MVQQAESFSQLIFDQKSNTYQCQGAWSVLNLNHLLQQFKDRPLPELSTVQIDGSALTDFDSAGALTLIDCVEILKANKKRVEFIHFDEEQQALLSLVEKARKKLSYKEPQKQKRTISYLVGKEAVEKMHQAVDFIALIGDVSIKLSMAFGHLRRFQFASIITNIYSTGVQALPIVGLLAFLIGIVLAYQMGLQLQTYGANIFIAYLSGMAIFREFGPLITAIIVAGRTSSAFTAQIGSMKVNEEIDALNTMGLSPTELLVMPKVLALLFIFPLLIFWSDFFSILGAMLMSKWMLNIGYVDFLTRLQESVGLKQLRLGLYKAPAFAALIALVGCFQGFRVQSSADNIGYQTTKSVVQALFLIIITDATYSIIYSWINV